jgi:hypothetical protein
MQVGGQCVGLSDQGPATAFVAGWAGGSWYVACLIWSHAVRPQGSVEMRRALENMHDVIIVWPDRAAA